jgi:hypothetical protein
LRPRGGKDGEEQGGVLRTVGRRSWTLGRRFGWLEGVDGRLAGTEERLAGANGRLAGGLERLAGTDGRLAGAFERLAGGDDRLEGALDGRRVAMNGWRVVGNGWRVGLGRLLGWKRKVRACEGSAEVVSVARPRRSDASLPLCMFEQAFENIDASSGKKPAAPRSWITRSRLRGCCS